MLGNGLAVYDAPADLINLSFGVGDETLQVQKLGEHFQARGLNRLNFPANPVHQRLGQFDVFKVGLYDKPVVRIHLPQGKVVVKSNF